MTSKEFILWLKGFTQGVHEFNISPKQWDYLKDVLSEVSDEPNWQPEHGPNSPTIQNINESLEDLEKRFWAEQPPEPFATPEELAKYNIDAV